MKKILPLIGLLFAVLIIGSCNETNSPRGTVMELYNRMEKGDVRGVLELQAPEYLQLLDEMDKDGSMQAAMKEKLMKESKDIDIKVGDQTISKDGKSAVVEMEINGKKSECKLYRDSIGKWIIQTDRLW